MARTAAVTGSTGTIGRIVSPVLFERGFLVVSVALPDHDLTDPRGSWVDRVASADMLIHLAGVMEVGLLQARASLDMLWNALDVFRGDRLIVASSAAVDPEAFGLPYSFNTYSARCVATEAFARAWANEDPGRRVDALRFGMVTEEAPDFGHRGAQCTPGRLAAVFSALLDEEAPGFRVRYVLGGA